MKLAHPLFSKPIVFEESKINILIVENGRLYAQMAADLKVQIYGREGNFILSQNDEPIPFSKNMELLSDVLFVDCNQRKIISKISEILCQNSVGETLYWDTAAIKRDIVNYMEKLVAETDLPLQFDDDFDISQLIKSAGTKMREDTQNIAEKVLDYMEVMTQLFKTKCFVLLNFKAYCTNEELQSFYKTVIYKKYTILLMEPYIREALDCEHIRVIDADLCEIYIH